MRFPASFSPAYLAAQLEGHAYRKIFKQMLPWVVRRPIRASTTIPCQVWSLSSERDVAEQVLSIRSFLRHVGQPKTWNIVSDGSHSNDTWDLLRRLDPAIRIWNLCDILPSDVHPEIQRMINGREPHVGKKLALEVYLPVDGATVYTDSDVLFFPGGSELAQRIAVNEGPPLYLRDVYPALDPRLVGPLASVASPVNAGFFILFRKPDWMPVLEQLSNIPDPGFHQEQSLVHLMMQAEHGQPLDPRRYLLSIDDWSTYQHCNMRSDVVLRHYVSTVRHKMWCRLGRSAAQGQLAA